MLFGTEDSKFVLNKDAAKDVVKKIFDYYEIEVDSIEDKEQKKFIQQNFDRLIKSARLGRLEVDTTDGIKIKQHLRDSDTIIQYKEIDGYAKKAMAGKDPNDFYGRIYAVLGSTSELGEAAISKLKGVDLGLAEVLGAIFLQP